MYQVPVIGYVLIQRPNPAKDPLHPDYREGSGPEFVITRTPVLASEYDNGMGDTADEAAAPEVWATDKVLGILPAPEGTIALCQKDGNITAILHRDMTLSDEMIQWIIEDYVADNGGRAELPINIFEPDSNVCLINPDRIAKVVEHLQRAFGKAGGPIGGMFNQISFEKGTIIVKGDS